MKLEEEGEVEMLAYETSFPFPLLLPPQNLCS